MVDQLAMLGTALTACTLCVLQSTVCTAADVDLLHNNMLKYLTFEQMLDYQNLHKREKRQAGNGDSVSLDDSEVFHGPRVTLPEISFRDMAGFVDEALKTIDGRFETLEKEIYRSSARQQPGTPEWFMAASTKTKETNFFIALTISN